MFDKRVSRLLTQIKCWNRICIYCYDIYLQLQNWMKLSVSQSFLVMSERLPTLSESSLQCWTVWKWILVISQSCISETASHQHTASSIRSCANLSLCFRCLSAAERRVSTISAQMKCWYRICIYCYDMYLQVQNWMKLSVSRVSQLPTRMCPEFKHKSNVDLESASIATTYTDNCKIEWS